MYNFISSLRTLLLVSIGLGLNPLAALAQMQFASKVVDQAGIVANEAQAADNDLTTSAVIKPTLLLGFTKLRVAFPTTAAANKEAGLYIKPNVLISLALLGGATVNTFYNDGTTTKPVDSYQLSNNLLSLAVQPTGITKVVFMPTEPFNQLELVFFSTLALGQDIGFYEAFSTINPLPVTLTAFQAKPTLAGVALSWATASERNADQFVVERATGVPAIFQAIGRVRCVGNTAQAQSYQFLDAEAAPAGLCYYRLRQRDLDGTETFSPVLAVQREALAARLLAYPSPTTGPLTVVGGAGTHFTVLDQLGRPVQQAHPDAGQQLDVRNLPSGLYLLQDDATGQRTKFIKAD